jgi:hypothetical protein
VSSLNLTATILIRSCTPSPTDALLNIDLKAHQMAASAKAALAAEVLLIHEHELHLTSAVN